MLWLALQFPQLGLELARLQAQPSAPHSAARILIERQGQRSLLACVCPLARAAGLRPGQALMQAQALLPQVEIHERDTAAEGQALGHLASCAYRYSPLLQIERPNALLLEIGGSLRLYGQASLPLLQALQSQLQALGFAAVAGLGRTPSAARLRAALAAEEVIPSAFVAQSGQASGRRPSIPPLDPLPVAALPLPATLCAALQGSGIADLAALRGLPRAGLQRRFGSALVRFLDQLEGRSHETIKAWRPPASHRARIELPAPTAQGEGLRFPLRRLVSDLCLALRARDACLQALNLDFELERDGSEADHAGQDAKPNHSSRLELQLLAPSRDPQQIEALIQQRLERWRLPGRVLSLGLSVPLLQPHQPLQGDLFDPRSSQAQDWPALLERLRARLGDSALLQARSRPDHRPEQAAGLVPVSLQEAGREDWPAVPAPSLQQAPLWLLPEPRPCTPGPASAETFIERIEGGWWDGADIRRDYYRWCQADGSWHWIYRDPRQADRAFLHGSYG